MTLLHAHHADSCAIARSTKPRELPPLADLLALFRLDVDSGTLFWRRRVWKNGRQNTLYADRPAGGKHSAGYLTVKINGRYFLAHRVIFKIMNGVDPAPVLDHKNNCGVDNRPNNIRPGSQSDNLCNKKRNGNPPFPRGVWPTGRGRYTAVITKNRKRFFLGTFDTPGLAHAAYRLAARKLHGDFARFD